MCHGRVFKVSVVRLCFRFLNFRNEELIGVTKITVKRQFFSMSLIFAMKKCSKPKIFSAFLSVSQLLALF